MEEGGDGPLFVRARSAAAAAPALAPKPVRRVVRVAELVARLRIGLQETFPSRFWLEGEVGGYKVARSGHAFFVLKEENACVEAVIWQDRLIRVPFTPEEGTSVLALVSRVDFFAPAGRLRLHVEQLEPVDETALLAHGAVAIDEDTGPARRHARSPASVTAASTRAGARPVMQR